MLNTTSKGSLINNQLDLFYSNRGAIEELDKPKVKGSQDIFCSAF
jgi:hypothetical protein